ncbi:LysE family transporter [Leuconostoc falkenbergense]|uniref:LysE family transporter n=1 Tax=Leuconostoc falkenbergense TaxID=2766470 RepID=UPI0024ACF7CE|nr:LysE family transporter [Leuconostoc falkenbergense]MDI6666750.1 LysE family transporter [Leuconostoc falkenbergense]
MAIFFSYTIVTALSPGPNNILAINATSSRGLKNSQKLLWGIYAGFSLIMLLCGLFSKGLVILLPNAMILFKYLGIIYIFWLAWHIANSKLSDDTTNSSNSFLRGFMLQFANVKIILWGITAFTSFILPNYRNPVITLSFIILLSLIGNLATFVWAVAGEKLSELFQKYWRIANLTMAGFLVISALQFFFE